MQTVREATRQNMDQAELIEQIESLGTTAVAIAKKAAILS